jgi:pilus assembly protein FimV
MVVATSATLAAAAVAAELDAQYVKELLEETPATDEELDSAFDLSLDDLENAPTAPAPEPVPELDAFPMDDDLSFESVLKQQTEANESLDDLSEFDLDLGADAPAPALDDEDFLLDLGDDLKGLDESAAETPALLDTPADDLELPADFDLSLADEMDAPKDPFESELDDVNAELDRLSDSLGQPSFTAEDALASAEDEPDFDFLSGTDEVATKLDLAQAYIDMGDHDGARDILGEVLSEGDATQKSEAQEMLARLV